MQNFKEPYFFIKMMSICNIIIINLMDNHYKKKKKTSNFIIWIAFNNHL